MTWRSLLIQNGGKLSLQRRQLLIQQNGESHTIPLEDIAIIIIENRETLITAPLLSALAEHGTTLLTCDEQFLPCGQWLPYAQYHRQLKILKLQLNISEPLKKQLWQHIVRQKILNQAFVANETGNDLAAKRLALWQSKSVQAIQETVKPKLPPSTSKPSLEKSLPVMTTMPSMPH